MRRLTTAVTAVAVLPFLLAACSADAGDFKTEAEQYIESSGFAEDAGLERYPDVECEEPASTDEETRYTCVATAEDGTRWHFEVEITGSKSLTVLIPPTPLDTVPTGSTEPTTGSTEPAPAAGSTTPPPRPPSTTAAATTTTSGP